MPSYTPPPCERDLELDSYKLWLSEKYKIEKNALFGKFVAGDRMLESLEEALQHAHAQDLAAEEKYKVASKVASEAAAKVAAETTKKVFEKNERYKEYGNAIVRFIKTSTIVIIVSLIAIYFIKNYIEDTRKRDELSQAWNSQLGRWGFQPPDNWDKWIDDRSYETDLLQASRCDNVKDYMVIFSTPGTLEDTLNILDKSFLLFDAHKNTTPNIGANTELEEGHRLITRFYRTTNDIPLRVDVNVPDSAGIWIEMCEGTSTISSGQRPQSSKTTQNPTPPAQITPRQRQIIRIVLNPDGYIDEELHREFWAQVPDSFLTGPDYAEFRSRADEILKIGVGWQREVWLSAKASEEAGSVVRSEGFEVAKTELMAFSRGSPTPVPFDQSFTNANQLLEAAASGNPMQTPDGATYITADAIANVLKGLDASIMRYSKLMDANWE